MNLFNFENHGNGGKFDRMVENKPNGLNPIAQRQAEEKEQRRQLILEAAKQVFSRKGYQATAMVDIAREARLGKATLYYYFPTKDDLYLAVYEAGVRKYYDEMMTVLWETPEEVLFRTMVEFFVDYMERHRTFLPLFFPLERHAPAHIIHSQNVQQIHTDFRQNLNHLLATKITNWQLEKTEPTIQLVWTYILGISARLLRGATKADLMNEIALFEKLLETSLTT
jgi:AcrR family transcriptional regulator